MEIKWPGHSVYLAKQGFETIGDEHGRNSQNP
jgi:hypothetical protein